MGIILETERLILREFTLNDTAFIISLLNSPGWLEYIGNRNVSTEQEAKEYLQNGPLRSYRENGFGLSMVEIKAGRSPIGMCGILKRDTLEYPDIGYALLPGYTGKGYAFEIAAATITYAKNNLKLSSIAAITDVNNISSIKLLQKTGFKFSKMTDSAVANKNVMLFIICFT